jgi:putative transposase
MLRVCRYNHKSHNVSVVLYHIVSSAKFRRVVFLKKVGAVLLETCREIEKRYDIHFLEIGIDNNNVFFLVQSVVRFRVTKIVRRTKSIIAKEVFDKCPKVKKQLCGRKFWGKGYFTNTVCQQGTE